jgi:hypothetical protein
VKKTTPRSESPVKRITSGADDAAVCRATRFQASFESYISISEPKVDARRLLQRVNSAWRKVL